MTQYQRCHRLYYLNQHLDGSGVVTRSKSVEMYVGIYVHHGIETLLWPDPNLGTRIEDAISVAMLGFHTEVDPDDLITYGCDPLQTYQEMECLIEGLIRAWYIKRYPYFRDNFDIIEVEVDRSVPLVNAGVEQVVLEFKLDALLRHKDTGLYYILSNKTTNLMDIRKTNDALTDMQGNSEIYGIETALGIKVHGVIMEWLITGKKEIDEGKDGTKEYIHWSPLIRGWYNPSLREYAWRFAWEDHEGKHKLGKGWVRAHAKDNDGGVKEWVDSLVKGEMFPQFKPYDDPLKDIFISAEYYRSDDKVNTWLESIQYQELQISKGLYELSLGQNDENSLLNKHFPMYTHACNYPLKCSMYEICHGSAGLDPYVNGFEPRVSHHVLERGDNEGGE